MDSNTVIDHVKNFKDNDNIFLICDQCLWNVTCLNKLYLHDIVGTNSICPVCKQNQLSSFPVTPDVSFKFTYPKDGKWLN
ncbi:MAG TPA: hypothetical protein VJM74_07110 [Nitrososphaeraceae archaeon]|nr:hypothetical protein [Nitrososphaeraceae archaeon]